MVERVAKAREISGPDPVLLAAVHHLDLFPLGGEPVGDIPGSVGRAVVDDQDLVARRDSYIRRAVAPILLAGPLKYRARGKNDRLDVLRLVVGRQDKPGDIENLAGIASGLRRAHGRVP